MISTRPRSSSAGSSYSSTSSSSRGDSPIITYSEETERKERKQIAPKSTWTKKPVGSRTLAEHFCGLAIAPESLHHLKPSTLDRGPIQDVHPFFDNLFVLAAATPATILQELSYFFFPQYKWTRGMAYGISVLGFIAFAVMTIKRLDRLALKFGTLGEKIKPRDRIPDKATGSLAKGIVLYMFVRPLIAYTVSNYDPSISPLASFTWTFPIRLCLWLVAFDYFFYVYHRSTHQVASLWKIHKHHHSTRRPTPILSILADDMQELLEIFLVPLSATLVAPAFSSAELCLVLSYTIYVETLGHSGIRARYRHPILFFLREVGMELEISDHELHHASPALVNLGKQSRVWDKLFGTMGERIETYE